jgi:phosphohistidine swiveling domain-containing protein
MANPTGTLTLSNGKTLEFEWVIPDGPSYPWVSNSEHENGPLTPMEAWMYGVAGPGVRRAWAEAGVVPLLPAFEEWQLAGPFQYLRIDEYPPDVAARLVPAWDALLARHGGSARRFWTEFCEPRIHEVCRQLAASVGTMPLRALAEAWGYGWHQTFTSVMAVFYPVGGLATMLAEAYGEAAMTHVQHMIQGGTNASQEIDAEVADLAALARAEPAVRMILESAGDDALARLRDQPAAARFLTAFDAFVASHATRSEGWVIDLPTWAERPEAPLALIRAQAMNAGTPAADLAAGATARREQAIAEALGQLPAGQHETVRGLLATLDGYVEVREGRAYRQMVLTGEARLALLRTGARLVREGRLDDAGDILFVDGDAVDMGTGDLRALAREGRAYHASFAGAEPPPMIGTPPPMPPPPVGAPNEVRGIGASSGRRTGRARVVRSSDEGDRLELGDVLVCKLTTPAWTPLFGIAGAVVTETGSPTSHPAITAREYGIPCVVSAFGALTKIQDGDLITVDGTLGVVAVVERAGR